MRWILHCRDRLESTFAIACCRCAMAKRMRCLREACVMPWISPVSCVGKKPFGTVMYMKTAVRARVAIAIEAASASGSARQSAACGHKPRITRLRKSVPKLRKTSPALQVGCICSTRAAIMGVSVRETKAEITIVTASVTANCRNRRPATSPMKSKGMSTAMSETVSERIVKPICSAALERRLHRLARPLRCSGRCFRS